jgi:hypothetical protein
MTKKNPSVVSQARRACASAMVLLTEVFGRHVLSGRDDYFSDHRLREREIAALAVRIVMARAIAMTPISTAPMDCFTGAETSVGTAGVVSF